MSAIFSVATPERFPKTKCTQMSPVLPLSRLRLCFRLIAPGIVPIRCPAPAAITFGRASAALYRSTGIHLPLAKRDQLPDLADTQNQLST